jgi:hypothetical protein
LGYAKVDRNIMMLVETQASDRVLEKSLSWIKLERRFLRRGLIVAAALHLAFPFALIAPQWWVMASSKRAIGVEHGQHQDQFQGSDKIESNETASTESPPKLQRSQLRIIFSQSLGQPPTSLSAIDPDPQKAALEQQADTRVESSESFSADPEPQAIALAQTEPLPQLPEQSSAALALDNSMASFEQTHRDDASRTQPAASEMSGVQASVESPPDQTQKSQVEAEAISAVPATIAGESATTGRKAQLEAELRSLSERIQAYQRQQEKEQANNTDTIRGPAEANTSASDASPASVQESRPSSGAQATSTPAPESATREAMIQARLPVKLKAFRGQWKYKMYYGERADDSVVAQVRFEVEVTEDLYVLRSFARPQGLAAVFFQGDFTQESRGVVSEWGYRPAYYEEQRGQRGKRWAQMDWDQREVRLSDGARLPIAQGVQDRLSIAWQLSALANSQLARLQSPDGVQIPLILSRHIELNRFFARAAAEEIIDGQRLRLLKVEREARPGKRDASIEVWLDVNRDMLPVRLRIEDRRGRVVEQLLQKE